MIIVLLGPEWIDDGKVLASWRVQPFSHSLGEAMTFRASKRDRMLQSTQNADTYLCQLPITIICLWNGD